MKEKFYRNKKESFGTPLFASPAFLTKFPLSVLSVWSPGLIENLTIWSWDLQNLSSYTWCNFNFFLTLVLRRSLKKRKFEVELLYLVDVLFTNSFHI